MRHSLIDWLVVSGRKLVRDQRSGHLKQNFFRIFKSGSVLVDPGREILTELDHPSLILVIEKAAHVGKLLHGSHLLNCELRGDCRGFFSDWLLNDYNIDGLLDNDILNNGLLCNRLLNNSILNGRLLDDDFFGNGLLYSFSRCLKDVLSRLG